MTYRSPPLKPTQLLASLGTTAGLEKSDVQLLHRLESVLQPKACQQVLCFSKAPVKQLYVLDQGWACSYREEQDGRHQIIDVFLPGEILGLRDFTFSTHRADLAMLTHGKVVPLSLNTLIDLVQASPRLTTVLLVMAARQGARLTERLLASRHPEPRSRLAYFVSEIHLRLDELGAAHTLHFYFPLSSSVLGSLLDLSGPQVDGAFNALEAAGVMKKYRHHIEVFDKKRLYQAARPATVGA